MPLTRRARVVNAVGDGAFWLGAATWRWVAVLVLVTAAVAYCSGRSAGARSAKLDQLEIEKHANTKRIERATAGRDSTHREAVQAVATATAARTVYQAAATHVRVVSDSSVSIDNALPVSVPTPVVSQLRAADTLESADSIAIGKVQGELAACGEQNAAYLERISILERENALLKPPRYGFKAGFVVGVVTIATAVVVLASTSIF